MSESFIQPQLDIYNQLTAQPRQDFFDMQHSTIEADESYLRQSMLNQDWELALREYEIRQNTTLTEPLAEIDDDPELFNRLWGGDPSAINDMYDKYSRKAEKIARKYITFVAPHHMDDDLLQAAQVGLGEAARAIIEHRTKMDKIGAVIYFRVLDQVVLELYHNNHFGSANFGRKQHELVNTEQKLTQELGRLPQSSDIALAMNCRAEEVALLKAASNSVGLEEQSHLLDAPATEELVHNTTPVDDPLRDRNMLTDSTEDIVLDTIIEELRVQSVQEVATLALNSLSEFDRDIFVRAYGLNGKTQEHKQIANALGQSRDNIRQILSRRRKKLQDQLESPYGPYEAEPIVDGRF